MTIIEKKLQQLVAAMQNKTGGGHAESSVNDAEFKRLAEALARL